MYSDEDDDDPNFENNMLLDKHVYRVPMRMADAAWEAGMTSHFKRVRDGGSRRPVVTDAFGDASALALSRPGWRFVDNSAARDERRCAYDAYERELTEAYKNPPTGIGSKPLENATLASRKNPGQWQFTGASSVNCEWRGAQAGDACTVRGGDDEGEFGADGTLQWRGNKLVCVATHSAGRQRFDGGGAGVAYQPTERQLMSRLNELRQEMRARGYNDDAIEQFVDDLLDEHNPSDIVHESISALIREFEMARGEDTPSQRRVDTAAMLRDHAARMALIYAEHDRELTEAWRGL